MQIVFRDQNIPYPAGAHHQNFLVFYKKKKKKKSNGNRINENICTDNVSFKLIFVAHKSMFSKAAGRVWTFNEYRIVICSTYMESYDRKTLSNPDAQPPIHISPSPIKKKKNGNPETIEIPRK